MRIAYLVNQYPKVSHTFIRREIAALEALGAEVLRFSVRRSGEAFPDPADRAEADRTEVLLDAGASGLALATVRCLLTRPVAFGRAVLLAARLGHRSDRGLARHLGYLAEACLLLGRLEGARPDRVHAHFATNAATVAMLCHALGGPAFSFTAHGPEDFDRARGIGLTHKLARAAEVFAISHFARSQLLRRCDPPHWDKIHVVRCGLDDGFLGQPPTAVPESHRLVCVGRLCEQKGLPVLVDAVARLVAEGVECELVLAGDGELADTLQARIADQGLEGRARITGWVSAEQVHDLLGRSRGMVLPSFAEGLPVVIMEAFAAGRPVVTTWVAGIPELVEPGRSGWLVPPGSLEDLVEALRSLLQTPVAELTRMGAAGRERVLARHDADLSAQRMLTIWSGQHTADAPDPVRRDPVAGRPVSRETSAAAG